MSDRETNSNKRQVNPLDWVDQYGDYLYRFAYARLRNQTAAEDVVQETFLAALKAQERFAGASTEKTWLTGILKHKIIDHIRKSTREKPLANDDLLPAEQERVFWVDKVWGGHWVQPHAPVDWGSNPDSFLSRKEFWEILKRCVEQLPTNMAAVFSLHEMKDLTGEEICKELNLTSTNLWVILHRSRKQVRRCLEINWIGEKPAPKRDDL